MTRAAILAMCLAGCASPQWQRPGSTVADFTRDQAACQYETDRVTAAIPNPVTAGVQDAMLNASCLKARGWVR